MIRTGVLLFFLFVVLVAQAQVTTNSRGQNSSRNQENLRDSTNFKKEQIIKLSGKTHYTDYKIISYKNDTTYIDTTLSIKKEYQFNFLRKDNFELLPFHNQGQTFNNLGYTFDQVNRYPTLGASAMHYNFYSVADIDYYHVPTPTTELMLRSGLEQGQVLDALFTFNTSKRLNMSIAYKGLRSLGKYRTSLSSHGNMRLTFNYRTTDNAYSARGHIVAQDLTNDENGGLTTTSITNFETKDPNFTDRARLETNFNDAETLIRGNRYYLEQAYKLWQRKDSLNNVKTHLKVGSILNYERKHHNYKQDAENSLFGDAFFTSIDDHAKHLTLNAQGYVALKSPLVLGEVKFKTDYHDYKYGYDGEKTIDNQFIPAALNGNTVAIGGEWKTTLKKFNIDADASTIVAGDLTGNYIKASASYNQDSLFSFKGTFLTNSKSPNFNYVLNQSDYIAYNWFEDLKNESTRSLIFDLKSEKLLNANVQITQIDNYTYFSDTTATTNYQPKPLQASLTVNYLKAKVSKEFKFGKFALNNTIMYQKVAQGSSFFRVPDFVTRNTLYFSDHLFKGDPLFLQTGITLKYFSKYYANSYNPVLSEFHLQNEQEIGGYPVFDFFINAQIQRTRLFFKIEHFNSDFQSTNNYYSAPSYPYRDFVIRFGLVWDFFI
tara:strand:+ start:14937 stop:16913 length:1977 start_codon:yes stop_codon:yes gene_type:complete